MEKTNLIISIIVSIILVILFVYFITSLTNKKATDDIALTENNDEFILDEITQLENEGLNEDVTMTQGEEQSDIDEILSITQGENDILASQEVVTAPKEEVSQVIIERPTPKNQKAPVTGPGSVSLLISVLMGFLVSVFVYRFAKI